MCVLQQGIAASSLLRALSLSILVTTTRCILSFIRVGVGVGVKACFGLDGL